MTGHYKWHFQTVHHDLWDYDLPAPPNLVTIKKDGKDIDAVAQVTKHGFVFVLDRETGKPLYPVEERKVPASTMPGEEAWPTQPFPAKPKAFVRQSMTEDDLNHYPDSSHTAILEKFRSLRYEGLFTPPEFKGTLSLPATRGERIGAEPLTIPTLHISISGETTCPRLLLSWILTNILQPATNLFNAVAGTKILAVATVMLIGSRG